MSVTWVQGYLRCSVYSLGTTSKYAALTDSGFIVVRLEGWHVGLCFLGSMYSKSVLKRRKTDHLESMIKPKHSEEGGLGRNSHESREPQKQFTLFVPDSSHSRERCMGVCPWWLRW